MTGAVPAGSPIRSSGAVQFFFFPEPLGAPRKRLLASAIAPARRLRHKPCGSNDGPSDPPASVGQCR